MSCLSDLGVSPSEITHIILTHHHDDHCGLLNKILAINGDIRVVMSTRAQGPLLTGHNGLGPEDSFVNEEIKQEALQIEGMNTPFTPYRVRDADILITGEARLKDIGIELDGLIVLTPGHSKDSISVLLDNGDSFVGDAAANMGMLQLAGANYCIILINNLDEYYRSW